MHPKHGRKVSHSSPGAATIITAEGTAVVYVEEPWCFQILYVEPQLCFEKLCVCTLLVWTVDYLKPCMGLTPEIPVLWRSGQEKQQL